MTDLPVPVTEDDLTPGPWVWRGLDKSQATLDGKAGEPTQQVLCLDLPEAYNQADLQFIAAARINVPFLLSECRRLQAALEAVRAERDVLREQIDKGSTITEHPR